MLRAGGDGTVRSARERAPDPDLHQNGRRRHDGARRHEPGAQRPTPGSARTPTSTRPTRRSASPSPSATCRPTSSTLLTRIQNDLFDVGRRPVHAGGARPGLPAAAHHRCRRRTARGGVRRATTRGSRSCRRSSCPAGPRARRCCIRCARSCAAPSGRRGRCSKPSPERTNRTPGALPQPAERPDVHPGPDRQPGRRRAVAARRRALTPVAALRARRQARLGALGEDADAVVGDRKEAAADLGGDVVAGRRYG